MFQSGFVSIVGLPNAGKSTFMNRVLGQKISIISSKPQTTRTNIHGVLTQDDFQIVFVDTPGAQTPRNKLGEHMAKSVKQSLVDVDVILFMVDINFGILDKEMELYEQIKGKAPIILCLNKCDMVNDEKVLKSIDKYSKLDGIDQIVPISAKEEKNLDRLVSVIREYLPEGPMYYPADMVTDQPERLIAAEIIREKALNHLRDEIPHGIGVEIMKIKDEEDRMFVSATMYCEKDSHKGMIIGKQGAMLKTIGKEARMDLRHLFGKGVYLELWVKVVKDWRNKQSALTDLGFEKQ